MVQATTSTMTKQLQQLVYLLKVFNWLNSESEFLDSDIEINNKV